MSAVVTAAGSSSGEKGHEGPGPVPLLLGAGWHGDRPGGLDRYLADLYAGLVRCGASPRATVVGPAHGAPEGVVAAGLTTQALPQRLWRFRRAAERAGQGVAVVDAHFALYAFWPVVAGHLRRLPLVVHFQGPWAEESVVARSQHRAVIAAKRRLERAVYRHATVAVTLSTAFKRILVEDYGVSPWMVAVIPPGVDIDRFRPGDRGHARVRLGLPPDRPIVATVRRLEPRMGIDVLLEAWGGVLERVPDACLLVIGDGSERASLESTVVRHDIGSSVRFLGRVDDATLVACYRAADLTVVPTTALEGFGLVVLESLACATPVVVTDAGGLPEAVTGLAPCAVVAAGDATALGAAVARGLTEAAATPSAERCRAHAEAHGWDDIARRHVRLYTDAVAAGAGPADRVRAPRARLRVVYLDHCAQLSGAELALLTLLPSLVDVDAHVILAEDGPLVSRLVRQGISVEVMGMADVARQVSRHRVRPGALPARSMASTAGYVLKLARRLRRLQPDLVHTNSLKAAVYGGVAARLAGIPVVWHVHDRIADDYLPGAAVHLMRAMSAHIPDRIVASSEATLATLGRAADNGVVVANPVRAGSPATARPRAGRDEPLRVGMIGRLAPWKGQTVFLDAFARVFRGGQEQAVIVGGALFGEDDYGDGLQRQAAALGLTERVEFRGFRDDVTAELATMDIAVHASIVPEPFGQVIVEAMAAGVPVIASDAGGPAEIITPGVDGLLSPPGDVGALATSLRRLADDPGLRERLRVAGHRRARDFAPDQVAGAMMGVYQDLVGTGRAKS